MSAPFLKLPKAPAQILRRAQLGAARVDLLLRHGRIEAVEAGIPQLGLPETDLDGSLVWPALHDVHTHLDKGQIWSRQPNPDGSFAAALAATARDREARWTRADMAARMEFTLRCAFAHGTASIRTHLDTAGRHRDVVWPLFREVQARWRGRIALQAVSLCRLDQYAGDEGHAIARQVASTEGGVLGGLAIREPGLSEGLDRLFELAAQYGLDLDLHVDENADAAGTALEQVARTVLRRRFKGRVLCGHCCSLAVQPPARARRTIALAAAAGLGVVSLPLCNLYLMDRQAGRTPRWRGVTLLQELHAAGVPVMLASDNTRDPFYAYGDLDMLEVFNQAVRIGHLDHPFGDWPEAVTQRPARWMGGEAGLRAGQPADLVIFDARSLNELLARPQADRAVIRDGRSIDTALPRYRELDGCA